MFPKIEKFCRKLKSEHALISEERKAILKDVATSITEDIAKNGLAQLTYICTHNSRRSHFGQVWACVSAEFYGLSSKIKAFSGGTEVTALHPNSIIALKDLGFQIKPDSAEQNPSYEVAFGNRLSTTCFSKMYDDAVNPKTNFIAIMTCSHADENCPWITGAKARFSTPYEDPKRFDNTDLRDKNYAECALEIGREVFYMMSLTT